MRLRLIAVMLLAGAASCWGQVEIGSSPFAPNKFSVYSSTGQSVIVGDVFWRGRVAVGTHPSSARMEIKASTDNGTAFRVAGVDETPFLVVSSEGYVGAGVSPTTDLDIGGQGGPGWDQWASLGLRNGNRGSAGGLYQIAFGAFGGKNFRHALRTIHADSFSGNGLDLLLWDPGAGAMANMARLPVASLRTRRDALTLHICPVGFADADLIVSDGATAGGGLVHRRHELVPAGSDELMVISYLGDQEAAQAYGDLKGIRHAATNSGGIRPVFESLPGSLRRQDRSASLDGRITEAELAAKELIRRLEGIEKHLGAQP